MRCRNNWVISYKSVTILDNLNIIVIVNKLINVKINIKEMFY